MGGKLDNLSYFVICTGISTSCKVKYGILAKILINNCFKQPCIDKVNEKNWKNMLMNINFLPLFYQYYMNKPSYCFYLVEFWSETLPMCCMA